MTQSAMTVTGSGGGGSGTLTSLTATAPIVVTPDPITETGDVSLADSAVTPGVYPVATVTVDAKGLIQDIEEGIPNNTIFIETKTASASASIEFTDLTYPNALFYRIELCNVLMTSPANLLLQTSSDNGMTWDTGVADYAWNLGFFVATSVGGNYSVGDSSINLTALTVYAVSATPGYTLQGSIDIRNPAASNYCNILTELGGAMFFGGDTPANIKGWGARLSNAPVNAVRIITTASTIASGTFSLYAQTTDS